MWAGHYRRYETHGLRALLHAVGLEVVDDERYGFPLANALEQLRARTWQRPDARSRSIRTAASGVDRAVESRFYPLQVSLPGQLAMRAFFRMQDAFLRTELGNGLIALARKPGA